MPRVSATISRLSSQYYILAELLVQATILFTKLNNQFRRAGGGHEAAFYDNFGTLANASRAMIPQSMFMLPTCELHEQYAFVVRRVCVERAGLLKACMCGQDAADSTAADLVIVGSGQLSSVQMSQGAKCDGLGL